MRSVAMLTKASSLAIHREAPRNIVEDAELLLGSYPATCRLVGSHASGKNGGYEYDQQYNVVVDSINGSDRRLMDASEKTSGAVADHDEHLLAGILSLRKQGTSSPGSFAMREDLPPMALSQT